MTETSGNPQAAPDRRESFAERAVSACIERIRAREDDVRAFVQFDPDGALAQARALDGMTPARRRPLYGLPIGVKEVFDAAGLRCSWGSPIHATRVPERDCTAVMKLKDAGAVVMGTTVSTEYAISRPGPTRNPFDPARTPGASSSGSAAAVGAGMLPLALGSQTIGSIIRPATYCGVLGFKPTWGTIDGSGAMPLSEQLDHPGLLAREIGDLRAAFAVLRQDTPPPRRDPEDDAGPDRVHMLQDGGGEPLAPSTIAALARARQEFEARGIEVVEARLPEDIGDTEEILRTILCRDMARHHGGDRDRAGDSMSQRVREMIDLGRNVLDSDYAEACSEAHAIAARLDAMVGDREIILTAATLDVAPLASEGTGSRAPQRLWTLAGMPAAAVPCGMDGGLPIGVQLVAARGQDDLVLASAGLLDRCRDWQGRS